MNRRGEHWPDNVRRAIRFPGRRGKKINAFESNSLQQLNRWFPISIQFVPIRSIQARRICFRAELAEAKKRAKTYKERKKHDRFDGMPEEEVSKRVLPDHLASNLDIIIVS